MYHYYYVLIILLLIVIMESNDRLNLQNDKEIEKIIPFEIGKCITNTHMSFTRLYAYMLL